jgi:hypothetical protein
MAEDERLMALTALGFARHRLPAGEPATVIDSLIGKISTAKAGSIVVEPIQPALATPRHIAEDVRKAVELADHFQTDRHGKEQFTPPSGSELRTLKIVGIKEARSTTPGKQVYLRVVWSGGKGSCFDKSLWQYIVPGQECQLWIQQSGSYENIVGVRV